jgi:hypothetical protein
MERKDLALQKAIESGDTDLVYLVVLHIKRTNEASDFIKYVISFSFLSLSLSLSLYFFPCAVALFLSSFIVELCFEKV